MPNAEWFYSSDGKQQGPVTVETMRQWSAAGQLPPETLVWKSGMAQWTPAGQVAELGSRGGPPPMPGRQGQPVGYYTPTQQGYTGGVENTAGMRMLLPVGRSVWAIIAGYLGLFSVLLVFAPFALVTGIIAVIDIKKHPDKHGMGRAIFGIIMGLLFSFGLLMMLIALASSSGPHRRY